MTWALVIVVLALSFIASVIARRMKQWLEHRDKKTLEITSKTGEKITFEVSTRATPEELAKTISANVQILSSGR
jgi:hypothetical protein